jgi:hypothetical protein
MRGSNLESVDSAGFIKIARIRRRPRALARHDDPDGGLEAKIYQ